MNKKVIYLLTTAAFLGLSSCSNVDDTIDVSQQQKKGIITDQAEIQAYLGSLKAPGASATMRASAPTTSDVSTEEVPGYNDGMPGYWVITKKHYKASAMFDETMILDPNAEILYPGCVLKGSSIEDGTYTPLTEAEVGDITFSISKVVTEGTLSESIRKTIFNPRLSEYREAFNDWAKLNYQPNAVTSMHSVESITSKEEAMAKVGATFRNQYVDFGANFGFDFDKEQNHILAKFIQKQYTVTTDFPKTPTIFTSINPYLIDQYQPVYVSNLTYGRMIFLSVDTKHSLSEVRAALNFAIKAIDLNIELETQYKKVLDDSKINVTIIGGGAKSQNTALINGWEGFKEYMTADISMSEVTPISFSLRYAKDNSMCRVVSNGEYDVITRSFVPEFKEMYLELSLSGLKGTEGSRKVEYGPEFELYGTGWITYNGEKISDIFNIGRKNYINVKKGKEFTQVTGQKCIVCLKKKDDESFQDFLRNRVRVYTHMRDYDARIIPKNDKDYSETYQEFFVSDLLAKQKSMEPKFSVVGSGAGVTVETQFEISSIYFK